MANLTDERLREMEDEMNRFEEEITTQSVDGGVPEGSHISRKSEKPKMDVRAVTLEKVQAHLANKPLAPPPPPPPTASTTPKLAVESISKNALAAALIPPPPPPPAGQIGPKLPESCAFSGPRMAPPPPPPGFLPPQLRQRPPMAPPPRMPMPPHMMQGGMPHGGRGPGPYMHPGMMAPPPPPPHMMGGQQSMQMNQFPPRPMFPPAMGMPMMRPPNPVSLPPMSCGYMPNNCPPPVTSEQVTVEQPKVVYSAAPVRTAKVVEKGCLGSTVTTAVVVKSPSKKKMAVEMKEVTPGIELNVPVEKIVAEKKQSFGVPLPNASATPSTSAEAASANPAQAPGQSKKEKKEKKKKFVRMAAGTVWEDQTLADWDQDDFRLFCGDLGNEVTDETLIRAFNRYPSFQKAKVIRDKRSQKTKGFGFVSFKDPNDFAKAMREMNGKYVGNRPIKLRKSAWQDRQIDIVKKKDREKKRLGFR